MKTRRFLLISFLAAVIAVSAAPAASAQCAGSVAVDGPASIGDDDDIVGNTMTISHTTSGTDRLMIVGVSINPPFDEVVDTLTYNGTALTFVGADQQDEDARIEIWSLVAPNTGTHDVVITFNPTPEAARTPNAGVLTFTGVDQTTPLGTFASAIGTSAGPATVDVSSATGELVIAVAAG